MSSTSIRTTGLVVLLSVTLASQTKVVPPDNKYSADDDVKLGQQAAVEAERQLPILNDAQLREYVAGVGQRLVNEIPAEIRHPQFRYSFKVVDARDMNAFALPGGPMYVNRGMVEAARSEGELAGVVAHEVSHVALRHGTAQASKATKYEIGAIAGQILGSIIGGNIGAVVAQGSQFGLGAAFLRFGREYERQADIQGAQIMARAGYDPRDMATMFTMLEQQEKSRSPEWLSSHPDPGNRAQYITREAQSLRVANAARNTRDFELAKARVLRMPPAPTTAQASRNASSRPQGTSGSAGGLGRVEAPSTEFERHAEHQFFSIAVPRNWRELPGSNSVTFAPEGAYASSNDRSVFTHGVEVGLAPADGRDLQSAADALIATLSRGNPDLRRESGATDTTVGTRPGLRVMLSNTSEMGTGRETVGLYTTLLPDGNLLYAVTVVPQNASSQYAPIFDRVVRSIQLGTGQ